MEECQMLDVVHLLGIPKPPKGRGAKYRVKCPACVTDSSEKTLGLDLEENIFHCFKCGCTGRSTGLYLLFSGMEDTPENRKLAFKNIKEGITSPLYVKPDKPEKTIKLHPIASVEDRNKTYTMLLNLLTLTPIHRGNLLRRGLTDTDIARLGYRSLNEKNSVGVCQKLINAGCVLEGVPGFYKSNNGKWALADADVSGILIPYRNVDGKIIGVQKRLDQTANGKGKFRWLSSSSYNRGTKAEGCVHIAGNPDARLVVITEGGMKADIVNTLCNKTVVAVPGVNSTQKLRAILEELRENHGLEILKLAFDMDFISNPQVEKAYNALVAMVEELEIPYNKLVWDPKYKGLDDFLKYCKDSKGNK